MTRDAMLFLPAKVAEGLLVIGCSSLYSHIFVEVWRRLPAVYHESGYTSPSLVFQNQGLQVFR